MKYVAIVGSISKDSINMRLAQFVAKRYSNENNEIEVLHLDKIPMYNRDDEQNMVPEVIAFKNAIKSADGVIWVTPEYNQSIPGVLKNAIDWISRVDNVINNKPSMMMGTTPGFLGTVHAQLHLRDILSALGSPVLIGNDVLIGGGHKKLTVDNNLNDESTVNWLDIVMNNFENFVNSKK